MKGKYKTKINSKILLSFQCIQVYWPNSGLVLKRHVTYRINMFAYLLVLMLWFIFWHELVLWGVPALKFQSHHSYQNLARLRKTYLFKTSRNVQFFGYFFHRFCGFPLVFRFFVIYFFEQDINKYQNQA